MKQNLTGNKGYEKTILKDVTSLGDFLNTLQQGWIIHSTYGFKNQELADKLIDISLRKEYDTLLKANPDMNLEYGEFKNKRLENVNGKRNQAIEFMLDLSNNISEGLKIIDSVETDYVVGLRETKIIVFKHGVHKYSGFDKGILKKFKPLLENGESLELEVRDDKIGNVYGLNKSSGNKRFLGVISQLNMGEATDYSFERAKLNNLCNEYFGEDFSGIFHNSYEIDFDGNGVKRYSILGYNVVTGEDLKVNNIQLELENEETGESFLIDFDKLKHTKK